MVSVVLVSFIDLISIFRIATSVKGPLCIRFPKDNPSYLVCCSLSVRHVLFQKFDTFIHNLNTTIIAENDTLMFNLSVPHLSVLIDKALEQISRNEDFPMHIMDLASSIPQTEEAVMGSSLSPHH